MFYLELFFPGLNGVYRLMCEDEERASSSFFSGSSSSFKKLKTSKGSKVSKESNFVCHEIYTSYGYDVSFYHVWLDGVEYLLDSQWRLNELPEQTTFMGNFEDFFVVQKNTCDHYPSFEDISKAKKTLPSSLFEALSRAYIKGLLDYVEFDVVPKKGYPYKSGTAETLIMHYEKCNSRQNREACVRILFDYLRTVKKENVHLSTKATAAIYLNDMVKILTWKNVLHWNYHIFYSKLQGGEDRLLIMLACARKRRAGDNFFAQFPKDVMFGILFPLLRWSLPLIL
jgi:hypothetical protein